MSDTYEKRVFRKVLDDHTKQLSPPMKIANLSSCHSKGTKPRCQQRLSPIDLFNILQPSEKVVGLAKPPDYADHVQLPVQTGGGEITVGAYDWYDLSVVFGHGSCVPALLHEAHLSAHTDNSDAERRPLADCKNIITALNDNVPGVTRVMKHSFQPTGMESTVEDLVADFNVVSLIQSLRKGAGNLDPLLENEHARILYCEDSLVTSICASVKKVYSTEGSSIGINSPDQDALIRRDSLSESFNEHFINQTIK